MKAYLKYLIYLFLFDLLSICVNGQQKNGAFIFQYIPIEKNNNNNEKGGEINLVQNIVKMKYSGYYDSTFIKIEQEIEEPDINGLRINSINQITILINLTKDSLCIIDSQQDSAISFKLLYPVIQKTGDTKMIGDYQCERYIFSDPNLSDFELWLSDKIPSFLTLGIYNNVVRKGMVSLVNNKYGEIRLVSLSKEFKNFNEITKLPKKIINDSVNPLLKTN